MGRKISSRETRICPICNNEFISYLSSKKKYCSLKCAISSEERKEKIRKYLIGKKQSPETIEKRISKVIGTKHTKETLKKMRGKKRSQKFKENRKRIMKELWRNGGMDKEHIMKIGKSRKNKKQSEETCKKKSLVMKGKPSPNRGKKASPQTKLKHRISIIKNIEKNYGICFPAYNKQACEFFKKFDGAMETKGNYAVYGGGEYHIKELGYFPDYINFDLKLIIEIDEKCHFEKSGNLKQKDIQRQKEIQEFYPDFTFIRIREEEIKI